MVFLSTNLPLPAHRLSHKLASIVGFKDHYRMLRAEDGRERRTSMAKVATVPSISLNGLIAGRNDGPKRPPSEGGERIFAWYFGGDTDYEMPSGTMTFKVSPASAERLQELTRMAGALVAGRRTFDIVNAWGGRHPVDVPTFVVTHSVPQEWAYQGSPFILVTDGVESDVEQAKVVAGDKNVAVGAASIV
jgi:dihydrofolate reductase